MWPFTKKKKESAIAANSVKFIDGVAIIDVRGQTCPGYLLAIDKAVAKLDEGMTANLLITYPPCSNDVKVWCKSKSIIFLDLKQSDKMWVIQIQK